MNIFVFFWSSLIAGISLIVELIIKFVISAVYAIAMSVVKLLPYIAASYGGLLVIYVLYRILLDISLGKVSILECVANLLTVIIVIIVFAVLAGVFSPLIFYIAALFSPLICLILGIVELIIYIFVMIGAWVVQTSENTFNYFLLVIDKHADQECD